MPIPKEAGKTDFPISPGNNWPIGPDKSEAGYGGEGISSKGKFLSRFMPYDKAEFFKNHI